MREADDVRAFLRFLFGGVSCAAGLWTLALLAQPDRVNSWHGELHAALAVLCIVAGGLIMASGYLELLWYRLKRPFRRPTR